MSAELLETARAAARAGGEVLLGYFRHGALAADQKSLHDFVSQADRDSEAAVLDVIRSRHPDHAVLAEESGALGDDSGPCRWLVDPLDGTTNFLQGLPIWGVSIACRCAGQTVAAVVTEPQQGHEFRAARGAGAFWNDEPMRVTSRAGLHGAFMATGFPFHARSAIDTYLALFRTIYLEARAVRRMGAAALDLAYTAAGVYDGFFEFRLSPWDIAAGGLLIEEAGGRVTDLDGDGAYLESGNVVAGAPGVHRALLAAVAARTSESDLDRQAPRDGS